MDFSSLYQQSSEIFVRDGQLPIIGYNEFDMTDELEHFWNLSWSEPDSFVEATPAHDPTNPVQRFVVLNFYWWLLRYEGFIAPEDEQGRRKRVHQVLADLVDLLPTDQCQAGWQFHWEMATACATGRFARLAPPMSWLPFIRQP